MNCPHGTTLDYCNLCEADRRELTLNTDKIGRCFAIGDRMQQMTLRLAGCAHSRTVQIARGVDWCRDCGAHRSSQRWHVPDAAETAKEIDKAFRLEGLPLDGPRGDSGAKNVTPIKPNS